MNKNVNVFIAVVLCALLCGGFVWLRTADDEKLGWNIHDSYAEGSTFLEGASYTNASSAGSSSAGSLSIPQVSSSRSLRRSTVSSYAGAHGVSYGVAPTSSPNSSVTSSPMSSGGGLYATSSQTFKSFGSGNGGAVVGGGMRGGATMSNSSSPITYVSSGVGAMTSSPNSPITLSPNSLITPLSNPDGSYAAAPARSSSLFGAYGDIYASTTVGSYNPMSSVYGGHGYAGVRGKQNLPGSGDVGTEKGFGDVWLAWLGENYYATEGFDYETLRDAYDEWRAAWELANMGGTPPEFEDFLAWFRSNGGAHTWNSTDGSDKSWTFYWLPVGDVVPMLILAMLYFFFLMIRFVQKEGNSK